VPETLVKAFIYTSLLLAIGVCAARWVLVPRAHGLASDDRSHLDEALAVLLRRAAAVLFVTVLVRLFVHTAAAFGWGAALEWSDLRLMAIESRWGAGWRVQLLASGAALAAAVAARRDRQAGWIAATATVAGTAAAIPLLGHAAGDLGRMALHTVHIIGGGLWLGTLGALVLVPGPPRDPHALLRAFSPLALTGATLLVPTGVAAAWVYLGSLPALWRSPYGRLLAMKVALVMAAAACGYANWQRFRREREALAGGDDWRGPAAPVVTLEAVLALTIVLATSLLTEMAHP
jgi:putative copper resistance protein D